MKPAMAQNLWNKFQMTGTVENQPRSGRPKKVTPRMEHAVIQNAKKERCKPLQDLTNAISDDISETSVRNTLAAHGYHRRVARRVPYINPDQTRKRKDWGKEHESWTAKQWAEVIYSDECYIQLGDHQIGRAHV